MSNPFIVDVTHPTEDQLRAARLDIEHANLIASGRSLLQQSIETVQNQWEGVWNNPVYTPAERLARMGTDAVAIFQTSAIFTAAIYSIDPTLLNVKYLSAALPYATHEDGTITLV